MAASPGNRATARYHQSNSSVVRVMGLSSHWGYNRQLPSSASRFSWRGPRREFFATAPGETWAPSSVSVSISTASEWSFAGNLNPLFLPVLRSSRACDAGPQAAFRSRPASFPLRPPLAQRQRSQPCTAAWSQKQCATATILLLERNEMRDNKCIAPPNWVRNQRISPCRRHDRFCLGWCLTRADPGRPAPPLICKSTAQTLGGRPRRSGRFFRRSFAAGARLEPLAYRRQLGIPPQTHADVFLGCPPVKHQTRLEAGLENCKSSPCLFPSLFPSLEVAPRSLSS